jgi:ABC-type oligopeptide transport system substrate-binding subunit
MKKNLVAVASGQAIQMVHFLAAVSATQASAENKKGSTLKKLQDELKRVGDEKVHYVNPTFPEISQIRSEAVGEGLVLLTDKYYHTLTATGEQELKDKQTSGTASPQAVPATA